MRRYLAGVRHPQYLHPDLVWDHPVVATHEVSLGIGHAMTEKCVADTDHISSGTMLSLNYKQCIPVPLVLDI